MKESDISLKARELLRETATRYMSRFYNQWNHLCLGVLVVKIDECVL